MATTHTVLSRSTLGRSLLSFSLGTAALLLWGSTGCTRTTTGFCNLDEECDAGYFCAQPAHECTAGTVIRGEFSGGQQVPPTASPADGSFVMTLDPAGGANTYTFKHTVANATKMELFLGRVGVVGTRIREIPLDGSGSLMFDPDTVRAMRVGDYYLQIASSAFPNGEARAQLWSLHPDDGRDVVTLKAPLSGRVSSPGNESPASGTVTLTLDEPNGTLGYNLQHMGVQSTVTGLHLHRGGFNVNGPHVVDLPALTTPVVAGTLPADTILAQLNDPMLYRPQKHLWRLLFKSGLTYLNVHSVAFTKGELRGQMLPTSAVPFNVPLRAPPSGTSLAQGEGQFFLSADGATLAFRLTHSGLTPASVTFARGTGAARVLVACPALTASGGMAGAMGYCNVVASGAQSQLDITSLRQKNIYLVINPGTGSGMPGEIEGQLQIPPTP